jgi:hypothetical protein
MKSLYSLSRQVDIDSRKLLFWPNNPRLKIRAMKAVQFTNRQLLEKSSQKIIYQRLLKLEHQVSDLIDRISRRGFDPSHALIVQEVQKSGCYLVLEGNRRLTAIRSILADSQAASANRKSLLTIPCFVFRCDRNDESEARAQLVFDQHYDKKKDHTKIQSAHMLCDVYTARLPKKKGISKFRKDPEVIKHFSDNYGWTEKEFVRELAVVQLYTQITQTGNEVDHKFRERLTWPYDNPRQFGKYFGYDQETYHMDDAGLDRYIDLFIVSSAPIHNPKIFRSFLNIMRYGTDADVTDIRDSGDSDLVFEIEARIYEEKKSNRFSSSLIKIKKELEKLKVTEFLETEEEMRLIRWIHNLVDERVTKLVAEEDALGKEINSCKPKTSPKTIKAAIALSDDEVAWSVTQVVRGKNQMFLEPKKITARLLQRWGINSHGAPRMDFEVVVEGVVERMFAQDTL